MKKMRLGEILIAEAKINPSQLKAALAHQRRWGKKIGNCIVELGFLDEIQLFRTLSRALKLPMVDVTRINSSSMTSEVLDCVKVATARKHRIVPLAIKNIRSKKRLVVATSDPTNYEVFDEVQFKASLPLLVMISPDSDIDWFIRKYYMNEGEALPQNYVSGISLIQDPNVISDPNQINAGTMSKIFHDEEFEQFTKSVTEKVGRKKDD